jgi:hypothetical protein
MDVTTRVSLPNKIQDTILSQVSVVTKKTRGVTTGLVVPHGGMENPRKVILR